MESAKANLRQAEDDLRRSEWLYAEGAIAAQEVDVYRTIRDTAQAQVDAAAEALSLAQAGSRDEEIAKARAEVTQARGNLMSIKT